MIAPRRRRWVVDTNPVVYGVVQHAMSERFEPFFADAMLLVSFQTIAELRLIARRRGVGPRRVSELDRRISLMLRVPPSPAVIEAWAELMYRQERAGSRIDVADAWVAATALVYGCPVLTNDRGDFERIDGIEVLPPPNPRPAGSTR